MIEFLKQIIAIYILIGSLVSFVYTIKNLHRIIVRNIYYGIKGESRNIFAAYLLIFIWLPLFIRKMK